MKPHRDRLNSWLAGISIAGTLLLAACSFHLKGYNQASPVLEGLYISPGGDSQSLAEVLRRDLRSSGVKLSGTPTAANSVLQITRDQFKHRVVAVDADGKALESEYRLLAAFVLQPAKAEALPKQELDLLRQLSYSGDDELGRRSDVKLLQREMRSTMAGQIIRRLEALLK